WQDGPVDRAAEVEGQVAAETPERREARSDPTRRRRRAAPTYGVDAGKRHVRERPDDVAGAREDVLARDPRDPEVGELRDARAVVRPVGDHDVPRLDV